jgi:hypothetical protein
MKFSKASVEREGRKTLPKVAKRRRTRGAVMVEYAFLLMAFGVPTLAATIAGGWKMVDGYTKNRNNLIHIGP